ncbi:hypothetical protein I541_2955 [Mycobacteroides abscessus]|nr:hypothetical protein I541_2955 [Mycobacteroides abscessus]
MTKIAMLAAAAAFSVAGALGVSPAATAAADPPPPPVCYANRPSVNAIEQTRA